MKVTKANGKKVFSIAGQVLMVLSFILIAVKIVQYDIDFSVLASPVVGGGVLIGALAAGSSIFLTSFNYRWLLNLLSGVQADKKLVVPIYCGSNLYKYLPGNFMHFVGRNRLAVEVDGLTHAQVAFVTLTDTIFLCLAAVILAIVCVFNFFIEYISQIRIPPYGFAVIAAVAVIFAVLVAIFRHRLGKVLSKYLVVMKSFRPTAAVKLLVIAMLRLLVLSATYFLVLNLLGQPLGLQMVPQIVGLFVLSWVVGFVVPGAPGGLGVREAIMIMFLGNILSQDILTISAVIHRIVCILGDLAAYGMALLYAKRKG